VRARARPQASIVFFQSLATRTFGTSRPSPDAYRRVLGHPGAICFSKNVATGKS
jgi:hypothetical protein